MSGLFRYYKERMDADGEPLFWPGGPGGFPFRGTMPQTFKDEEYENLRPVCKVRCRTFYLANKDDLIEYMAVRAKIENQLYILKDRERIWDEESKNYRIFLEWVEPAYENPIPTGNIVGRDTDNPSGVKTDAIANYVRSNENAATLPYGRLSGLGQEGSGW